MSNHRIAVAALEPGQYLIDRLNAKADSSESLAKLGQYFEELATGFRLGKVRLNMNAVQAVGTLTFSSFVATNTVTLNGVLLTGADSPVGTSQFRTGVSDQDSSNALVALINASALDKIVGVLGAHRRATVTLASLAAADTVTVNGVIFTCKASPTSGVNTDFLLGGSDTDTAKNLADVINAHPSLTGITATASAGVVTLNYIGGSLTVANSAHATVASAITVITVLTPGQIGNLCTLAISANGTAVSPTGGTEGTEVILSKNYKAAV